MHLLELQPAIKAEIGRLRPEWRLSLRLREMGGGYRHAVATPRGGSPVKVFGNREMEAPQWAALIVVNLEREMVKQTGGKFTTKRIADPKPFGKTQPGSGFRVMNTAIPKGPVGVTASGMKQPKARTLAGPRKSPD